jgi:hypothetical protein
VMSALAPLAEPSPSIQPTQSQPEAAAAPPTTKANALRRLLGFGS